MRSPTRRRFNDASEAVEAWLQSAHDPGPLAPKVPPAVRGESGDVREPQRAQPRDARETGVPGKEV